MRSRWSRFDVLAAAVSLLVASSSAAQETSAAEAPTAPTDLLTQGGTVPAVVQNVAIETADHRAFDSTVYTISGKNLPRRPQEDRKGEDSNRGEGAHEESPELRKQRELSRLEAAAAEAFAFWTPDKMAKALPLDIVLDPEDNAAYQVGATGWLEQYSSAPEFSAKQNPVEMSILDIHFSEPPSLLLRGMRREVEEESLVVKAGSDLYSLDAISSRHLEAESLEADAKEDEDFLENVSSHLQHIITEGDNSKNIEAFTKKQNNKQNRKKNKKPMIKFTMPPKGSIVGSMATFGAKVKDDDLESVKLQLTSPDGEVSDWLDAPHAGGNVYEIKIEGLDQGKWKYQIQADDKNGNRKSSAKKNVNVDPNGGSDSAPDGEPPGPAPSMSSSAKPLPRTSVDEANWPYGGDVQTSTGRILFEFPNTSVFVCSGTVVKSDTTGRSIVLTAAHCIYNDVMKSFSRNAVFIPDQGSTTGDVSDFNFDNDPYGGYYLDFGVIEKGWSEETFPFNVEFDYGYYVVQDKPQTTHSGGFLPNLSGVLHEDVIPFEIDFETDALGEFTAALGFSAAKDPGFRYCTKTMGTVKAIQSYSNLFLDDCGLTGGSSGGPWSFDMDTSGMGTVISVNSWGFVGRPSMAGPSLRTLGGSYAECLFERAKNAAKPESSNGIIIEC